VLPYERAEGGDRKLVYREQAVRGQQGSGLNNGDWGVAEAVKKVFDQRLNPCKPLRRGSANCSDRKGPGKRDSSYMKQVRA